jgi:hypothetical protein
MSDDRAAQVARLIVAMLLLAAAWLGLYSPAFDLPTMLWQLAAALALILYRRVP